MNWTTTRDLYANAEDRASRLKSKIDDYLAFGVQYNWVIARAREKPGAIPTKNGANRRPS
jgi:hypothetical protein